ncbi:M4 family metallopeptidase [Aquimarina sp. RZ0]|uniref:M4 family metallopeptidase n=1 Tax=Aquimarina sp. RZ0 TaxID=2607730 RepID=UPI0011F2BC39|nr:M4 family metallopeptidase [Aquimarina sp. RZ0]KAA1244979.1 T9SS type A sorting domain-containing protein [Aquimarina sp. RZ0]
MKRKLTHKNVITSAIILGVILLIVPKTYGQHKQAVRNQLSANSGIPRFINFDVSQKNSTNRIQVSDTEVLKQYLPLNESDSYKLVRTFTDALGITHSVFQQYYNQMEVAFATYTVHKKGKMLQSLTGNFVEVSQQTIKSPLLTEKKALEKALKFIGANTYSWESDNDFFKEDDLKRVPKGTLVICKDFNTSNDDTGYLSYKFRIATIEPIAMIDIFINAANGKLLLYNSLINNHTCNALESNTKESDNISKVDEIIPGNAATRYYGEQSIETEQVSDGYRLFDTTRGNGIHTKNANKTTQQEILGGYNFSDATDFIDNDNHWTAAEWDNTNLDNAALDAHWAMSKIYDYYKETHNRKSYDNNDSPLQSLVHVGDEYRNAFWYNQTMYYGDSDDQSPLTTIDIAAHEMTHGVTTNSANLIYYSESGALNEAMSDIFSAAVRVSKTPDVYPWNLVIGSSTIRDMSNPNSKQDPDTYKGTYWAGERFQIINGDNRGVHTNSGVLNYWFYLLSEGGQGTNDDGTAYDVKAIGIAKAEKIAYRMLTVYLEPTSDYIFAKSAGIKSSEDLFGINTFETQQVKEAFKAVGVDESKVIICDPVSAVTLDFVSVSEISCSWKYPGSEINDFDNFVNIRYRPVGETAYSYSIVEFGSSFTIKKTNPGDYEIGVKRSCNPDWFTVFVDKVIPCENVSNINVLNIEDRKATISWDAVSGAENYAVYDGEVTTITKETHAAVSYFPHTGEQKITVQANCSPQTTSLFFAAIDPPVIKITSPINNEEVRGSFDVAFSLENINFDFGTNNSQNKKSGINYYIDDEIVGFWDSKEEPITLSSLTPGRHTIRLVLISFDEEYHNTPQATDSVDVTVLEENNCDFSPQITPLASVNEQYENAFVIGNGPAFNNLKDFTINWDLINKKLYQFSILTTDGVPNWWNDLLPNITHSLDLSNPKINIQNSGIEKLDGEYTITKDDDYLILISETDNFTIVFSNSNELPCNEERSLLSAVNHTKKDVELIVTTYPNPVGTVLNILPPSGITEGVINIYDIQGRKVKTKPFKNESIITIDVNGRMKNGVYYLEVVSEKNKFTSLVIKK